jgi:putative ABC transport system ATP-binding protein
MKILECQNVNFATQQQEILQHISFSVNQGDSIGIVGPSGAGKSTLLRLLNLLASPSSGKILYHGKELTQYEPTEIRRKIGYILQKPYLFGTTVRENLYYPYQVSGIQPEAVEIELYLEKAKLPPTLLSQKPSNLSGGEQQRISLLRSLLAKPEILLLDEITSALDEETTLQIEQLLLSEKADRNQTMLFITHNLRQAARLATFILQMESGKITYFGKKEDFFHE